jgi:hypothetical protein
MRLSHLFLLLLFALSGTAEAQQRQIPRVAFLLTGFNRRRSFLTR